LDARVREREGCVLVADKCGGMTRVVMAMLRELAVEIVFASRVVTAMPCCCRYSERRSYDGECTFRETLRDGSMLPCRSGED